MSEEQNESTWSGLVKTIIGTIATLITAGGAWLGSQLFGGEETPSVAQPQQQTPVINIVNQNQNNSQSNSGGTTKVIERVVEKPVEKKKEVVKKKEGDEFKQEEPKW